MNLVSKKGEQKLFLLGNEAIVRGALEAGVAYVSTYPGTPSSEIGDTFYRIASDADIYFEYSTNEKVALEFAMGTAFAGARSLCAMKHVGLNVAADALATVAYTGVIGGMVVVTADDPGCHSSQNEQDNRYYSLLANLPLLEPASPEECYAMTKYAFELSEELELPILLRTTTRVSHMRGPVLTGLRQDPVRGRPIKLDAKRFVSIPAYARPNHLRLLQQMKVASQKSEESPFNTREGAAGAPFGIITSGIAYSYVVDIIEELGLTEEIEILKLGLSHPYPTKLIHDFIQGKKKLLVAEELEPILEREVKIALYEEGLRTPVLGKMDETFPLFGEFFPDLVLRAVNRLVDHAGLEIPETPDIPEPPARPPTLCSGCPHRATYFAVLAATGGKACFETDIGCYTLGVLPPLETAHHLVDMGSSVNTAAAMSRESDLPVFAFIGDSTFFHSGMTGLVNAVENDHRLIMCILDNRTTAMTGHQPRPGAPVSGMKEKKTPVSIEKIVRGCGVEAIRTINPDDLQQSINTFEWAIQQSGVTVIISRAPCALLKGIDFRRKAKTYQVNQDQCRRCGAHSKGVACIPNQVRWQVISRSNRAIKRHGQYLMENDSLPAEMSHAPCSNACPAGLCVQGYMTHTRAGEFKKALKLIREFIPFPAICGYVCDRPCEDVCVRKEIDTSLAIRDIKRFISTYDEPADSKHYMVRKAKKVPKCGRHVAIVGAGPAGLTAAHDLVLRGYDVTVFDRAETPGGIMQWLIPGYRLPKKVVADEIKIIELMGVTFACNKELGKDFSLEELTGEYDAVLVALGAGPTSKLGLEKQAPNTFRDGFALLNDYIAGKDLGLKGKKVAVIGGGNAAIDCARVSAKAGAQVKIVYRRSKEQMPAGDEEIALAESEGIPIHFLRAPMKVYSKNGTHILETQVMKLGEKDASGRARPIPADEEPELIEVDFIIPAIGQQGEPMTSEIQALAGKAGNRISINPNSMETDVPKVFSAGDAVLGPSSIIWAIAHGKKAAWGIDMALREKAEEVAPLTIHDWELNAWKPPSIHSIIMADRISGTAGKSGDWADFTENEAKEEANRCLSCGRCGHCLNCIDNFGCPAIFYQNDIVGIDPTLCVGCGVCAQLCPNGAITPVQEVMS